MNQDHRILLRCTRTSGGCIVLYTDNRMVNLLALKQRLFAWHKASFYGTIIELEEFLQGHVGIVLNNTLALDYLAGGIDLSLIEAEVSPELKLLEQAASIVRKCLTEGHYMPDYSKWLKGGQGWKLLPVNEDAALWTGAVEEALTLGIDWLEDWLDDILGELRQQDPETAAAWNTIAAYPSSVTSAGVLDEEDWLIAIGWQKDNTPYRILLRLVEPEADKEWSLETVLQNKEDPSIMIVYDPEMPELNMVGKIRKEQSRWLHAAPELANPLDGGRIRDTLHDQEAWEFLTEGSLRLVEAGAHVLLPSWWEKVQKQKLRLKAKVRSSVGSAGTSLLGLDSIIQFDWRLAVGDLQLSEEDFRQLSEHHRRLVQINGRWILLDPAMLERIRAVMKRTRKNGLSFREVMELHLLGGDDLEDTADDSIGGHDERSEASNLRLEVELNEHLRLMLSQLQSTNTLPMVAAPEGFHGDLRRYQQEGVSWMLFLQQFGLGGCLADDMGLGKTIQWIAYLLHMKHSGRMNSPALLICPTSVIGNWQMELERFAPDLRIHLHYGSSRSKGVDFTSAAVEADVVVTSYTLSHMDEAELGSVEWSSLCLDEAQNIKNAYTKQSSAIRKLNARHRIALTGTPIENRLTELWSIFDFINPGYLSSLGEFKRTYVSAVEKGEAERIAQVQKLIRPFLLRRLKKDPAIQLDLPEKNEMKTYVPLTLEQGAVYESILQNMFDKLDRLSPMERRGLILSTLTRLKQACDHPALLQKDDGDAESHFDPTRSAKLARLVEMVEELRSEGDKCLIFTQYVEMGHILKRVLESELGESVLFLHGGVPKAKRDEMIEGFQGTGETGIFILSLKAGGTGLNLTAANHVFHFDRWWNPVVENQATDRAFRIGQTRDVQVHKFISLGTLEERIDQMMAKKQGLNHQIIGTGENWITEMSTSELRELFALRRQWMQD